MYILRVNEKKKKRKYIHINKYKRAIEGSRGATALPFLPSFLPSYLLFFFFFGARAHIRSPARSGLGSVKGECAALGAAQRNAVQGGVGWERG